MQEVFNEGSSCICDCDKEKNEKFSNRSRTRDGRRGPSRLTPTATEDAEEPRLYDVVVNT